MTALELERFDVVSVIRATCDFCGDDMEAEGDSPKDALQNAVDDGWQEVDDVSLGLSGALWCGTCKRRKVRLSKAERARLEYFGVSGARPGNCKRRAA